MWFDSDEYLQYGKEMREYFKPLETARSFLYQECANITQMSADMYNYYVVNEHRGFVGNGTTWVVLVGFGNKNETQYMVHQMQKTFDYVFNDSN